MTLASPFAGMPAYRDLSGQWYAVMGIERDTPISYGSLESFATAPADEAWVFSCIRRLYQAVASTPLRVYVRAGQDLVPATMDNQTDQGDALQDLLDYVAPYDATNQVQMTGADLKAYTTASYGAWGECYWVMVRGMRGGPPQELHWVRAPDVTFDSADGSSVSIFHYRPTNAPAKDYLARDVVPFRTPNLKNPLRGLPPLSAVRSDIATGRYWAERLATTQANDSVPPGYWQIPQNAQFTKQDESLVRRTLRALRDRRNKGRVPIMPNGVEFKGISLTPHDAEMVAQRKLSRMAVCAALGVPLVLAGDDDKNTVYGNLREARRLFWTDTVIPLEQWYAGPINKYLVPEFDPTRRRLVVAFDTTEVEALKPVWDVEWNAYLNAVYAQAVVPNEFRRHFRVGPDVDWGNKPVPRTQIAVKAPETDDASVIPSLNAGTQALLEQPLLDSGDAADLAESVRALGSALYKHPAVRAWIANPTEPLLTGEIFGGRTVDTAERLELEAGLRRRLSAAQIAESLSAGAAA